MLCSVDIFPSIIYFSFLSFLPHLLSVFINLNLSFLFFFPFFFFICIWFHVFSSCIERYTNIQRERRRRRKSRKRKMLQRAASNAYSWWWASHIRTKQSKWLEQNLQGTFFFSFKIMYYSLERIHIWFFFFWFGLRWQCNLSIEFLYNAVEKKCYLQ